MMMSTSLKKIVAALVAGFASLVLNGVAQEPEKAKPAPVLLPAFADGEWKGAHAVYQHQAMNVVIRANGQVVVYPKAPDGANIGKGFNYCNWRAEYLEPEERRYYQRPIVEFRKPAAPAMNPRKVEIEGACKDDVRFKFVYEFKLNTLTVSGGISDPAGIKYPSRLVLTSQIPATHNFPPAMGSEERIEILKDFRIETVASGGGRRRKETMPYSEVANFRGANLETAMFIGAWAPRRVIFDTKDAHWRGRIYQGNCPWQGFYLDYYSSVRDMRQHKAKFILSVE